METRNLFPPLCGWGKWAKERPSLKHCKRKNLLEKVQGIQLCFHSFSLQKSLAHIDIWFIFIDF